MLRTILLWREEDEHTLLFTLHHIIADGWSVDILLQELSVLYSAERGQQRAALPALAIQYVDYTLWQRTWLQEAILEKQMHYWKQHLAGAPTLVDLPLDYPRPAIQTFSGVLQSFSLPSSLSRRLQELSREEGVTLFMVLLAGLQTLFARYSGQYDIVIGTPTAGRVQRETEQLVGLFLNILPLRTRFSSDISFRELLALVREVALDAYTHQDVPFEKLVETLQPERHLSHAPLFQVLFAFQNTPQKDLSWPDLRMEVVGVGSGTAKYDLTFDMRETPEGIGGFIEYNTDLFEGATIKRLVSHLHTLLTEAVTNPDTWLADLPLISEAERQQLLVAWNNTGSISPSDQSAQQLFEAQVERTPDAVAAISEEQQLTYHSLNQKANQLARHLQVMGVGPEVVVGVCLESSLEMITAVLAILKAGGAYVPLDPSYPAERLAFMLTDSRVRLLLTRLSLSHLFQQSDSATTALRLLFLDATAQAISGQSTENLEHLALEEQLAYVIYTSGSTGRPRGVLISQHNLLHATSARLNYYTESCSGFLLLSSFAFDSSVAGLFWTLCSGARLVLPPKHFQQDLMSLPKFIAEQGISHLLSIPSFYHVLLAQATPADLAGLRTVIVAGETCGLEVTQRHAAMLPQTSFFNEYGPTEGTVWSTVYQYQPQEKRARVPIGNPIAHTQIYILDAQLQPAPVGIIGDVYIGGSGLARGYLNHPALTAEKFIPHPFSGRPGARLYKSGDLARYLPDGAIDFAGRSDQQVKLRGFRIEPGEIEHELSLHPAVQECIVLAREDPPKEKYLAAYILTGGQQTIDEGSLRDFLRARLPDLYDSRQVCPDANVSSDPQWQGGSPRSAQA